MRILFCVAAAICLFFAIPSAVWGNCSLGCLAALGADRSPISTGLRSTALRSYLKLMLLARKVGRRSAPPLRKVLLDDLGDDARAHRAATLADGETEAGVHGDRLDQLDLHGDVVARHDHLDALGQVSDPGHVRGAEVELGAVAGEERRVTAALLLLEDVDLGLVLRVRRDGARLAQHLAALDLLALGATQQAADVVAGLALVEDLAEHLDTGDDGGGGLLDADDLDGVTGVDDALLDAARGDGAAARDREDVLDRHQEGLV